MDLPPLTNHQFKIKGNKLWTLTQEYYDELKDTYPLHDVEGEMRAAKLWCKNVSASRRKTARGMNRFLGGWVSRSEATGHVTVDPEKSHSEIVYDHNLKEKISQWESVIKEWTDERLRASKSFLNAYATYPEFRTWVKDQRAEMELPIKQDLPPPPTRKQKILAMVEEVKQAKADGRIEGIVRDMNLF